MIDEKHPTVKKLGDLERGLNKSEIVGIATENAREIIDSKQYDLLTVYIELKRYEMYLDTILEAIKQHALQRATQIGQRTFEYSHATVNIFTRTVWDFSPDRPWKELDDRIADLTQKKKEREAYLKEHYHSVPGIRKQTNAGLVIRL
jgi:hypothetical protein